MLPARRTGLERRFPKAVATLSRIIGSGAHCLRAQMLWRTVVLKTSLIVAAMAAAFSIAVASEPAAAQDRSITVFAAASMKNALDDADAAFTKKTGIKVVASYAASSALIKQIEQGAPADVFVSADLQWMDYA